MRAAVPIVCVVAALGAGCGDGEDEEEYVKRYRPLSERLVAVSQQISGTLGSGEPIGVKLNLQIAQLETVNRNIENLETPDELRDEAGELTRRVRDSIATLRTISTAVQDGKDAAPATVRLATQAQAVNKAREELARAAGAGSR